MKIIVGKGSCGIAAGANKISEAIEKEIKDRNLDLDIEVDLTGCIGMCYLEPIIDVIDDNGEKTTYVKVTPESIPEIIEKSLEKKEAAKQYIINDKDINNLKK